MWAICPKSECLKQAHQINTCFLGIPIRPAGTDCTYYGTCMMSELERMVWNAADYLRLYFDYNVPINTLDLIPFHLHVPVVTRTSIYTMIKTFSVPVENYYNTCTGSRSRVSRM